MIAIPQINTLLRGTQTMPGDLRNQELYQMVDSWLRAHLGALPTCDGEDVKIIAALVSHVFFPWRVRQTFNALLSYDDVLAALTPHRYAKQKYKYVPDCGRPVTWLVMEDNGVGVPLQSLHVVDFVRQNNRSCLILPCFRLPSERWARIVCLNQLESLIFVPEGSTVEVLNNTLQCSNAAKAYTSTKALGPLVLYKSTALTPLLDCMGELIQELKIDLSAVRMPPCAGWHTAAQTTVIKKYLRDREVCVDCLDYKKIEAACIAASLTGMDYVFTSSDKVLNDFLQNPDDVENITCDTALVLLGMKYSSRFPQMLVELCSHVLPRHKNRLYDVIRDAGLTPMLLFSSEQGVQFKKSGKTRKPRSRTQNADWARGVAKRTVRSRYGNPPNIRNKVQRNEHKGVYKPYEENITKRK